MIQVHYTTALYELEQFFSVKSCNFSDFAPATVEKQLVPYGNMIGCHVPAVCFA